LFRFIYFIISLKKTFAYPSRLRVATLKLGTCEFINTCVHADCLSQHYLILVFRYILVEMLYNDKSYCNHLVSLTEKCSSSTLMLETPLRWTSLSRLLLHWTVIILWDFSNWSSQLLIWMRACYTVTLIRWENSC
jgi:hypothetical protein